MFTSATTLLTKLSYLIWATTYQRTFFLTVSIPMLTHLPISWGSSVTRATSLDRDRIGSWGRTFALDAMLLFKPPPSSHKQPVPRHLHPPLSPKNTKSACRNPMTNMQDDALEERAVEILLERIGLLAKLHFGTKALTEQMFADLREG